MEQLTAGGGVVFRRQGSELQVLLIFRRNTWDLPKGKREPGEDVRTCAMREIAEETGSGLPQIHAELTKTRHTYSQGGKEYEKTTHWFAMTLPGDGEDLEPQREEGIEKVEWFPLSKAATMVGFENLIDVLRDFQEWYMAPGS